MVRKKDLGIFGAFVGAAVKLGVAASKGVSRSVTQSERQRKANQFRQQVDFEKKLSSYKRVLDEMDAFAEKQDDELTLLKAENKAWEKDFNKVMSYRKKAMDFEKEGKLMPAIKNHLKSIELAENSERLGYNNFAYGITRVVILYGKIKDKESLREFLTECIRKYPKAPEISDWEKRLSKIKL
ncbi:hypothetical protein [Parapedobacter soli]|uniref:hypothetical protein n=1 Tax=Parapedobacter soli TaxID=416955 RepID=UPI0021CA951B|nr:hypothetical protein [Parapedobacter soli]